MLFACVFYENTGNGNANGHTSRTAMHPGAGEARERHGELRLIRIQGLRQGFETGCTTVRHAKRTKPGPAGMGFLAPTLSRLLLPVRAITKLTHMRNQHVKQGIMESQTLCLIDGRAGGGLAIFKRRAGERAGRFF